MGSQSEIVAQGGNRVYTDFDPTAHGEMVVIRLAGPKLNTVDLSGHTLYTAMEPCPMCCWAILESRVSRLVLGGRHAGIGRKDIGGYSVETLLSLTGRSLDLVTGVRTRNPRRTIRAGRFASWWDSRREALPTSWLARLQLRRESVRLSRPSFRPLQRPGCRDSS